MKKRNTESPTKHSKKDTPYFNNMRRHTLANHISHIRVVYVINVSTMTQTLWCYIKRVCKLTNSNKCENKKLTDYLRNDTKKLLINLFGAISYSKLTQTKSKSE